MKKLFITSIMAVAMLAACQQAVDYSIMTDTDVIEVPSAGGSFTLKVSCSVGTKTTVDYVTAGQNGWISLLPAALQGDGSISITATSYNSVDSDREAILKIANDVETKEVKIVQSCKAGLSLGTNNVSTTTTAKKISINVVSNKPWTASVSSDASSWCSVEGGNGSGTGSFDIVLTDASDVIVRMGEVKVSADGAEETIKVQQGLGVVINGIVWAHANVDQPGVFGVAPDDRGSLYQYDSKIPYPNAGGVEDPTCPPGYETGYYDSGIPEWREENNPCPSGWRIPTSDEIKGIINIGYCWLESEVTGLSIPGAFVGAPKETLAIVPANDCGDTYQERISLVTKDNFNGAIFIPQAGWRHQENGGQWNWWDACITSCTRPGQNWDRHTYWINYTNECGLIENSSNRAAFPVRCVRDL